MAGRAGGSRDDIQEPDPEKRSVKLCFVIIGSPVASPGRGRQGEDQEQGKGQLLEGATPGPGKARIIAQKHSKAVAQCGPFKRAGLKSLLGQQIVFLEGKVRLEFS